MNIFKFIVVGLMFASANAGCQPSNERTECPTGQWPMPHSSIANATQPKFQCACKHATEGKYNALCWPGQSCLTSGPNIGTCSGSRLNGVPCTVASECSGGYCNSNLCASTAPPSSCSSTQCMAFTDGALCASSGAQYNCVWNGASCGCSN